MKEVVIIFTGLILFCSCKLAKETKQSDSAQEYFAIEIVQGDGAIKIANNTATLKKEPFKFKVTFINTDNVSVSASWGTFYYDFPESENIFECNTEQMDSCRFVAVKTGNQQKFNQKKELMIGDGSYQWNWFYDESMDWHRFDSTVTVTENSINAELTVENIYDCDARDEGLDQSQFEYSIENIDQSIYLVFATSHYDRATRKTTELQRERFKLVFKD
jgi:hypothetical protein